jgi:hypothetical protein
MRFILSDQDGARYVFSAFDRRTGQGGSHTVTLKYINATVSYQPPPAKYGKAKSGS